MLDNDSLALFLATANQADLALVRSLTTSASPSPDHWVEGNPVPIYYKGGPVRGRLKLMLYPTHVMWDLLESLAEIMPSMVKMTSFSFCAQRTDPRDAGRLVDYMRPWIKFALKALCKACPRVAQVSNSARLVKMIFAQRPISVTRSDNA